MDLALADAPPRPRWHVTPEAVPTSDGDLIQRVASGDEDAFAELYRRYARSVLGLARRRLVDPGRAEDATQDAFAAVWRAAPTYDPGRGRGGAWLYAIARNAVIDGVRRRPELVAEAADVPAEEPGPAERAEEAWVAWRVHRALELLPDHERSVIELAYWNGLTQTEVADRLALPLGTVKTRTRAGLARLADILDEELT